MSQYEESGQCPEKSYGIIWNSFLCVHYEESCVTNRLVDSNQLANQLDSNWLANRLDSNRLANWLDSKLANRLANRLDEQLTVILIS